jgi:hypothetical protein
MCGILVLAASVCQADAVSPLASLKADVTTSTARSAFLQRLHKEIIEENLAQPLNEKDEERWESAFWGAELCLYKNATTLDAVRSALNSQSERSDSFTRAALEAACTLYPSELRREVERVAKQTKNPKNFAMAVNYVLRLQPRRAKEFLDLSRRKFPQGEHDPLLTQLRINLEKPFSELLKQRPPLEDLLKWRLPGNTPVIFSFQRHNRDYHGLAVIRKADGSFVRQNDGNILAIPQLARSMSNCPGYLTNGNTPQGVFSILGVQASDSSFIGPSPVLHTVLPNEETVAHYFHDQTRASEKWSRELYRDILPPSWRDYVPVYEAYAAGEIGRSEILVHGTTIDPEFYKGLPYYPNSPSMGCMCALELWSSDDGHCLHSDQLALVNAYTSLQGQNGFVVVVELDDQSRPVDIYDVLTSILNAERSR